MGSTATGRIKSILKNLDIHSKLGYVFKLLNDFLIHDQNVLEEKCKKNIKMEMQFSEITVLELSPWLTQASMYDAFSMAKSGSEYMLGSMV